MAKSNNVWESDALDSIPLDMNEVSDTAEKVWQEFVEIWQNAFTADDPDGEDDDEADGLDECEAEPDEDDGDADSDESDSDE